VTIIAFFSQNEAQTKEKNAGMIMTFSRSKQVCLRKFDNFYFWTKIITYALFPPGPSIAAATHWVVNKDISIISNKRRFWKNFQDEDQR